MQGDEKLTAVSVEEPHIAVFVARDDDTFDTRSGHCTSTASWPATGRILLAQTLVWLLIQAHGRGNNGVYACRKGAVICLEACHAPDLLASASVVDNDSGIGIANHEGLAVGTKRGDTCRARLGVGT